MKLASAWWHQFPNRWTILVACLLLLPALRHEPYMTIMCCLHKQHYPKEEKSHAKHHLGGLTLATSCHHLCLWKHYTNKAFLSGLGIVEEEFHAMTWFSSQPVVCQSVSALWRPTITCQLSSIRYHPMRWQKVVRASTASL